MTNHQPTGREYTRKAPGLPASICVDSIPMFDKQRARAAAKIMRVPMSAVQKTESRFDLGWSIWFGDRFMTRQEWVSAAASAGIDLYDNDWHKWAGRRKPEASEHTQGPREIGAGAGATAVLPPAHPEKGS